MGKGDNTMKGWPAKFLAKSKANARGAVKVGAGSAMSTVSSRPNQAALMPKDKHVKKIINVTGTVT